MEYSVNHGAWNAVFAVPSSLVDQHIRLAGALQLKVLLWVLRHAGERFTPEMIAEAVGASAADVRDAMQYWTITGLLSETAAQDDDAPSAAAPAPQKSTPDAHTPASLSEPAANPPARQAPAGNAAQTAAASAPNFSAPAALSAAPAAASAASPAAAPNAAFPAPRRIPKPDGLFLAKRVSESEELSCLMQEAQVILGRALSPGLSSGLLMLFDDYGLPADVILMLLQYAKSRGRDNTSYIESVGKSWADEGINSHERAEQKLRRLDETALAWRRLQTLLGIDRRSPSRREEQFASAWITDWKFSDALIREAYNRCIDATGKMKLSYMNKILEGWHLKGISTLEAAQAEQQAVRDRNRKKAQPRAVTYDLDALEQMDLTSLPK